MTKKWRKIGHYPETTGPIGLKFFVKVDFGHGVLHTKFQPSRLKDAEDIGWCGWRANWCGWDATLCISYVVIFPNHPYLSPSSTSKLYAVWWLGSYSLSLTFQFKIIIIHNITCMFCLWPHWLVEVGHKRYWTAQPHLWLPDEVGWHQWQ